MMPVCRWWGCCYSKYYAMQNIIVNIRLGKAIKDKRHSLQDRRDFPPTSSQSDRDQWAARSNTVTVWQRHTEKEKKRCISKKRGDAHIPNRVPKTAAKIKGGAGRAGNSPFAAKEQDTHTGKTRAQQGSDARLFLKEGGLSSSASKSPKTRGRPQR